MELTLFLLPDPPVEGRQDSPATREEAGSERKPFLTATALNRLGQGWALGLPALSLCHFVRRERPLTCPADNPQTPIIHRMLNTAEPTMVPTPTSPWVMNTPGKRKAQTLLCKAQAFPFLRPGPALCPPPHEWREAVLIIREHQRRG